MIVADAGLYRGRLRNAPSRDDHNGRISGLACDQRLIRNANDVVQRLNCDADMRGCPGLQFTVLVAEPYPNLEGCGSGIEGGADERHFAVDRFVHAIDADKGIAADLHLLRLGLGYVDLGNQ